MLSVILGLFALPFGVIGRLWSVIVSVPGHPLLLDSSCKLFPCQILFSKKNKKKKKKNVSIFISSAEKLPSMRFHDLFNYNVYCADCMPFPGLIFLDILI